MMDLAARLTARLVLETPMPDPMFSTASRLRASIQLGLDGKYGAGRYDAAPVVAELLPAFGEGGMTREAMHERIQEAITRVYPETQRG